MHPPAARLRLEGAEVVLLGTIAGFAPDAQRVEAALAEHLPEAVALGVPPEDLEGLRTLLEAPDTPLPDLDPQTQRLFGLLSRFGPCRVPSPDLEAAYRGALSAGGETVALDMDDEKHSRVYVRQVGFLQAVRSGRVLQRLLAQEFSGCDDPYSLALAWDRFQNQQRALQRVEEEREAHMAKRLRQAAQGRQRVVAVVPAARFAGVLRALEARGAAPAAEADVR